MTNITYSYTDFNSDIEKGKPGEDIFAEDFLDFLKVNYVNVTETQGFRVVDTDFTSLIGTYEVKLNYQDNKKIIIEDYTNINPAYGNISVGWFYKSKADTLVFVSKRTRAMILIPFTDEFKHLYEKTKEQYKLIWNKVSIGKNGSKWQSAFRYIPLDAINGHFAYYKKVTNGN